MCCQMLPEEIRGGPSWAELSQALFGSPLGFAPITTGWSVPPLKSKEFVRLKVRAIHATMKKRWDLETTSQISNSWVRPSPTVNLPTVEKPTSICCTSNDCRGTNQTTYEQIKGAFSTLVQRKSTEAMGKGIPSWEQFPYIQWMIFRLSKFGEKYVMLDLIDSDSFPEKLILGSKLSTLPNS